MKLCCAGLIALALSTAPAVAEVDPIVLRFSHVVAEDTPKGLAARKFEELAERYTMGHVDVQVFPNSTLHGDGDELDAIQLGAVEMLAPSLAKFEPLGINGFGIFDLPFLFESTEDVHRIARGPIGRKLLEALRPRGIVGLAYWDNGFKIMSATHPLVMPADFKDMPVRVQPSRVVAAQMVALGAIPRVMPLAEVREALETRWVEGTENPPSNLLTQKMYEVQPYATLSNHGYLGYAVIANASFWESLPIGTRRQLERALEEATEHGNSIAARKNAEALARIVAAGTTEIYVLNPAERAAWITALWPVHAQMRDWIGASLVDDTHEVLGLLDGPPI
jgi:C4-dicarboxylate-binding protein DctP